MFLDDKALNLLHISVCLSHTAHLQDEAVYLSLSAPIFICRLEKWMFHITSSKNPSCNMSPSFACWLDYLSHSVITSLSLFKPPTPSKIQMLQALIISHPCTCLCFTSGLSHSFLVFHPPNTSAPLRRRFRRWQHQVYSVGGRCGNDLCYWWQDGQHPRHKNPGPRGAGPVHFNSPGRGQRH